AGLPGLALHYLSDRSRRRSLAGPRLHPWPYLGVTAFCVAYLPLVLYNLLTGGDSIASALHHTGGYAFEIVGSPSEYLLNIRNLLTLLVRVVGSNLSLDVPPVEYFQIGLGMLLLTGGMWYSAMRDRARPHFCVVASTVLLMPVFNKGYYAGFPIQNRYLATLLPACFCLMSLFLFEALVPALKTASQKSRWGFDSVPGRLRRGVLYLVLVLLAILPLRSSAEYYRNVQSSERSNLEAVRTIEDLARRQPPPSIVVLDPAWEQIKVGPGNDLLLTARTWLELKDRAYNVSR
ncbi:MAG TPA: hypothetical protein VM409_06700, partial [Chloroflexia bacterium]|nr:hypothetical protein [Chloroflexia bacterium]